jgi:DNA repair photolyase
MQTVPAKAIVSGYSESGWFASNYNMNIYRGCCHGCIYCDSRSECYHIENFDEVRAKQDALAIIERDLRSKRRRGTIITGAMSDPYNPFEREYELTRGALRLIDRYGFGIVIDTKSDLVVRDIDLLLNISKHSPVAVNFTVTTADDALCRQLERNVCPSSHRLNAIETLSEQGIMCGVLLMPILPFINDTGENIAGIIRAAKASGARWIYSGDESCFGVTLRQNQREHYFNWLDRLFPGIKQSYLDTYGYAYMCNSPQASVLQGVLERLCTELGLLYQMEDIKRAIQSGSQNRQVTLF